MSNTKNFPRSGVAAVESGQPGSREHWNKLARFFARMSREPGLGDYSDLLVDDADDEVSVADWSDESSEDYEGVYAQIGEGPALRVCADRQSPPLSEGDIKDAYTDYASIESLGCSVFTYSAPPAASEGFETIARRICQRFGMELLGASFLDSSLEVLAIVKGTRKDTELKVSLLWQCTEGDEGRIQELIGCA